MVCVISVTKVLYIVRNVKKKLALIKIAESFKDSEDWEEATNTMKKIQSDWKKIGHVPRKFSDDIWKKFKAACNHYFDRYHQQKNAISKEQQAIVDAKKEFLEKLKETKKATKDSLTKAINDWNDLGEMTDNVREILTMSYKSRMNEANKGVK